MSEAAEKGNILAGIALACAFFASSLWRPLSIDRFAFGLAPLFFAHLVAAAVLLAGGSRWLRLLGGILAGAAALIAIGAAGGWTRPYPGGAIENLCGVGAGQLIGMGIYGYAARSRRV